MKKLLNISKVFAFITGSAAVIGLLFGGFRFIQGQQTNTETMKMMTQEIVTVNDNIVKMSKAQYTTDSTLLELKEEASAYNASLESLRRTFTNYLLHDNTLTKEEFYEYMNELKNESE